MKDTQWPRFEVFQQNRSGSPFRSVGSVHAPDAEVAIQNARDTFVRRPETNALWVVPAGAVYARTLQQLEEYPDLAVDTTSAPGHDRLYHVFRKTSQRRSMTYVTHVGEVEAATPAQALGKAIEMFGQETTYVWWIVPADAIVRSAAEDADSWFRPARGKSYRLPSDYRTHTMMREVRAKPRDE